jgi:hypothetical protein
MNAIVQEEIERDRRQRRAMARVDTRELADYTLPSYSQTRSMSFERWLQ